MTPSVITFLVLFLYAPEQNVTIPIGSAIPFPNKADCEQAKLIRRGKAAALNIPEGHFIATCVETPWELGGKAL